MNQKTLIAGNVYDKYHSNNPIVRFMMSGFYGAMDNLLQGISPGTILDVGCGEGFLTERYKKIASPPGSLVTGADLSVEIVKSGKEEFTQLPFLAASVYELPFAENEFDLVMVNELLEHVDNPEKALQEIYRVTCDNVLISVPWEPVWRILNLCRLRYISDGGNTPGHIQHWSKGEFLKLVSNYLNILAIRTPFPWTMVLCAKNNS